MYIFLACAILSQGIEKDVVKLFHSSVYHSAQQITYTRPLAYRARIPPRIANFDALVLEICFQFGCGVA